MLVRSFTFLFLNLQLPPSQNIHSAQCTCEEFTMYLSNRTVFNQDIQMSSLGERSIVVYSIIIITLYTWNSWFVSFITSSLENISNDIILTELYNFLHFKNLGHINYRHHFPPCLLKAKTFRSLIHYNTLSIHPSIYYTWGETVLQVQIWASKIKIYIAIAPPDKLVIIVLDSTDWIHIANFHPRLVLSW